MDVGSTPPQRVCLLASGAAECTCGQDQEPCCHVAAAALAADGDGRMRRFRQESELRLGEKMLGVLGRAMPGGETVRLTPALRLYADGRVALGLSVGQERLYAVRSVADLLTCFALGTPLRLSAKFTYRPEGMRFSREDERLLTLLMNHIPLRGGNAAPAGGERRDRRHKTSGSAGGWTLCADDRSAAAWRYAVF